MLQWTMTMAAKIGWPRQNNNCAAVEENVRQNGQKESNAQQPMSDDGVLAMVSNNWQHNNVDKTVIINTLTVNKCYVNSNP